MQYRVEAVRNVTYEIVFEADSLAHAHELVDQLDTDDFENLGRETESRYDIFVVETSGVHKIHLTKLGE
jgi:hypothetical protein